MNSCDSESEEKDHAFKILKNINSMRHEERHCDFIIKVENEEIHVSRNVMSAGSDYFNSMLFHDTLESQSGVVEMTGMRFKPVKKCVDYFYTGKISFDESECEELLLVASMMQLAPVCNKIVSFLRSHLTPSSFFGIRKLATKFDLEELCRTCDEFALEKLDVIAAESNFNEFDLDYVSFLLSSKKSSYPCCEDTKLAIALQWIRADLENRCEHLSKLMDLLKLQKITPSYGRYLVENESVLYKSATCMRALYLAGMDWFNVKPISARVAFTPVANALLLFDLSSKFLQAYHPATKSWTAIKPLCEELSSKITKYTSVLIKDFLYVLVENGTMFRTDITDKESGWVAMKPMKVNCGSFLRCAAHEGFIYVIGGKVFQRFSEIETEWEKIECDSYFCDQVALLSVNNFLYCIGGSEGKVERFSHSLSVWTSFTSLGCGRWNPAVTEYKDKIFVAGGFSNNTRVSNVECFDMNTQTWTKLASMNKSRSCFALAVVDDQLYAVGRYEDPLNIELYSSETNTWTTVLDKTDMKVMSRATVAACLPS